LVDERLDYLNAAIGVDTVLWMGFEQQCYCPAMNENKVARRTLLATLEINQLLSGEIKWGRWTIAKCSRWIND
jgi:hypothetical protein